MFSCNYSLKSIFQKGILFFLLLFSCGCFNNRQAIEVGLKHLQTGSFRLEDNKKLDVNYGNRNYLLNSEEQGRFAFISNNFKASNESFNKAMSVYSRLEERGLINSGVSSTILASSVGNDNTLPYYGADFERMLVHFYSSLNYLSQNNLDEAMVEIRAANNIQKLSISKRENRVFKIENQIQSDVKLSNSLKDSINEVEKVRSEGKKAFLNAYIYYISGQIRELIGDKNEALVDYKLALELYSNNAYIIKDVLRLSSFLDTSYYQDLVATKSENFTNQSDYQQDGSVVVIYEQDFAPKKTSIRASLWLPSGIYTVALPFYPNLRARSKNVGLYLLENGQRKFYGNAQEVQDTMILAKNDLSENYPAILNRQIARGISRHLMQNANRGRRNNDNAVLDVISLYGYLASAVEEADTRSFRSLPRYVLIAKANSSNNIDAVYVDINNKLIRINDLSLQKGEIAIVSVIDTGGKIYQHVIYQGKKSN